jgi:hypothetical protein
MLQELGRYAALEHARQCAAAVGSHGDQVSVDGFSEITDDWDDRPLEHVNLHRNTPGAQLATESVEIFLGLLGHGDELWPGAGGVGTFRLYVEGSGLDDLQQVDGRTEAQGHLLHVGKDGFGST